MKKLQIYSLIMMVIFCLSSCLKDIGNYEYQDINEVSILGIEKDAKFDLYAYVDTLNIAIDITGTLSNDESRYSYEWKLIPVFESDPEITDKYVIATTKNLSYPVSEEPGEYMGYLNVTDKTDGTRWSKMFKVLVRSLTSEGYLVLSKDNNKGRLDLISTVTENDYLISHDIWRDEDYSHLGQPLGIFFNYNRYDMSNTVYVTEYGSHRLDKNLKTSDRMNLNWIFGGIPERVDIRGMNATTYQAASPTTYKEFMVDKEGKLYGRDPVIPGALFEFSINKLNGTTDIEIAPHIGIPITSTSTSNHSVLLYDNTNKQFVEVRNKNLYPTVMTFKTGNLFTAKTNREMFFVESTSTNNTISVLKESGQNKFYLYGITLGVNGENAQNMYMELLTANQEEIKQFAIHPILPYVFYATANKVYQFDYSQPSLPAKVMLNYGDKIVKTIDFFPLVGWNPYTTWERNKANILVVGLNTVQNEGIVEFYNVPSLGAALQRKASLEGFGEIIDIAQRER